jgi:outer membrane protein TolC
MDLNACLLQAQAKNPSVQAQRAGISAAAAARDSTRGAFGPTLKANSTVMVWDQETTMDFGDSLSGLNIPGVVIPPMKPTVVQEQVTTDSSLTLAQPITPLWAVYHGFKAAGLQVDVEAVKLRNTRRELALATVEAWFSSLQAQELHDTLDLSLQRTSEHLANVQKLQAAELVGLSDVLKVRSALASVKQLLVSTSNLVRLSRSNLATRMGLSAEQEPVPDPTALLVDGALPAPVAPVASLEEALQTAGDKRPEVQELRLALKQLDHQRGVVWNEFVPSVVAMGTVKHTTGSTFQKEDSWFVRLSLDWTLWQWGSSKYKLDENSARQRQAEQGLRQLMDFIRLEVKQAWLDLDTSIRELDAIAERLTEAQENYRVQQRLYDQSYKTMTDLLDAESALRSAQSDLAVARYRAWIARARLSRAMGEPVASWLPGLDPKKLAF